MNTTTSMALLLAISLSGCAAGPCLTCADDGFTGSYVKPDLDGPLQVHEFVAATPKLDVLLVVDGSSLGHRTTEVFLPELTDEVWPAMVQTGVGVRMAVVLATDPKDPDLGRLQTIDGRSWVDADDEDGAALLAKMVVARGPDTTKPQLARTVWTALGGDPAGLPRANRGFRRPDASLHIVAFSASPDATWDNPVQDDPMPEPEAFPRFVEGRIAPDLDVRWSSVGPTAPTGCQTDLGEIETNEAFTSLHRAIGRGDGLYTSICEASQGGPSLTPIADALHHSAQVLLDDEVILPDAVDPRTLEVTVANADGEVVPTLRYQGVEPEIACPEQDCHVYQYDPGRNSLDFWWRLEPDWTVTVRYPRIPDRQASPSDTD